MPKFIIKISAPVADSFFKQTGAECFIINAGLREAELARMAKAATAAGKIALLAGDNAAALCRCCNADGIVADLRESAAIKKDMARLREECGNRFLGVICRNRRHEAMVVSENEPDFIIFKVWQDGAAKTRELTEWYSQLFLIQMAVEPEGEIADIAAFGADMVILTPESYKILVAKKERLE